MSFKKDYSITCFILQKINMKTNYRLTKENFLTTITLFQFYEDMYLLCVIQTLQKKKSPLFFLHILKIYAMFYLRNFNYEYYFFIKKNFIIHFNLNYIQTDKTKRKIALKKFFK